MKLRQAAIIIVGAVLLFGGVITADLATGDASPPPVGVPGMSFDRVDIDQGACAQTLRANGVADMNGDGQADLLTAGDSGVYWFENPNWKCSEIATGQYGEGATLLVMDMNHDGRPDVVTGDRLARKMVWFENTPSAWVSHVLTSTAYCHNVSFADVNADGRLDLGCTDPDHEQISWLEAPADPYSEWTEHVIDSNRPAWGDSFADIDGDGRMDLVAGRAWYAENGDGTWTRYPYTTLADTARSGEGWLGAHFSDYEYFSVRDLNGDGRLDIFVTLFAGTPEGQVWAFLAPADPRTQSWTAVELDSGPVFSVHSLTEGDFDGSGRVQMLVGDMQIGGYGFGPNPDPQIRVYRLDGDPSRPSSWTRIVVDHRGTHEAVAVDLNRDALMDVVGGDENSHLSVPPRTGWLTWWRNTTSRQAAPTTTTNTTTTTSTSSTSTTTPVSTSTTTVPTTSTVPTTTAPTVTSTTTPTTTAPVTSTVPAPRNTALPAVSGDAVMGQTLSASTGTWEGSPNGFHYQWQSCNRAGASCADVARATGAGYLLGQSDVGTTLRVEVTATGDGGSTSAISAPSPVVTATISYEGGASFSLYAAADSQPVTVPSIHDGVLVFEYAGKLGDDDVTSVTYGGKPLTRLAAWGRGFVRGELWYLVDPPAGAAELSWTKSGRPQNVTWGVSIYSGVEQSDPFDSSAQTGDLQERDATPKALTVASEPGQLVVELAAINGGPTPAGPTAGAGQTVQWARKMSTTQGGSSTQPGATLVTMSWTPSGSPHFDWVLIAATLKPAGT